MNGQLYQSRRQAFINAHGGMEQAVTTDTGWLMFSDGAYCDRHPEGLLAEPSADPKQRLKCIVEYHEIVARRASEAFNDLKNKLTALAESSIKLANAVVPCPPPSDAAMRELERLKQLAVKARKQLADARDELDKLINPPKSAAQQANDAAYAEELRARLTKIQEIKI